jgi:hypothetical protein
MICVKRFICVLVMALVANWAGGVFGPSELTSTTHDKASTVAAMAPCHDHHSHTGNNPEATSPHQRHACCPAVGLPHTLSPFQLIPSTRGLVPPPTVHAYVDVIFSIDKPPKASD